MISPVGGFAHPALATMFDPVKKSTTQTLATSSSSATGASTLKSSSQRTSHVAVIAGGVIGGVVGSLLILGIAILFKRRNARSIIETDIQNTPNPYDHPPYPYDDEPKELPCEEVYAEEMKGSVVNHELEAEVPNMNMLVSPAELESPIACHEKDSTPCESPILPIAEFLDDGESGSAREGSLRVMTMLPDADGEGEGLEIVRTNTRVVSMLVDDDELEEMPPTKTKGQ